MRYKSNMHKEIEKFWTPASGYKQAWKLEKKSYQLNWLEIGSDLSGKDGISNSPNAYTKNSVYPCKTALRIDMAQWIVICFYRSKILC